ncbi:MAG: T9SS type A sorting domain-containing protein [Crocinitomicaceae bacterium]
MQIESPIVAIETTAMPAGIYVCKLKVNNQVLTKKLVKTN